MLNGSNCYPPSFFLCLLLANFFEKSAINIYESYLYRKLYHTSVHINIICHLSVGEFPLHLSVNLGAIRLCSLVTISPFLLSWISLIELTCFVSQPYKSCGLNWNRHFLSFGLERRNSILLVRWRRSWKMCWSPTGSREWHQCFNSSMYAVSH